MQQHFVTFSSPGTLLAEQSTLPIDSWDINTAVEMSKAVKERYGALPFGFRFSTRARSDDELDSKKVAESNMYYLGGRVMTILDVKREMPTERILISNMEGNNWYKVIVNDNSWRSIQPLYEGDVVLDMAVYV